MSNREEDEVDESAGGEFVDDDGERDPEELQTDSEESTDGEQERFGNGSKVKSI